LRQAARGSRLRRLLLGLTLATPVGAARSGPEQEDELVGEAQGREVPRASGGRGEARSPAAEQPAAAIARPLIAVDPVDREAAPEEDLSPMLEGGGALVVDA
jgi:hypothetical protein